MSDETMGLSSHSVFHINSKFTFFNVDFVSLLKPQGTAWFPGCSEISPVYLDLFLKC